MLLESIHDDLVGGCSLDAVTEMLAASTPPLTLVFRATVEHAILSELLIQFEAVDEDESGCLDRVELASVATALYKQEGIRRSASAVQKEVDAGLNEHDVDGLGGFRFREFVHMVTTSPIFKLQLDEDEKGRLALLLTRLETTMARTPGSPLRREALHGIAAEFLRELADAFLGEEVDGRGCISSEAQERVLHFLKGLQFDVVPANNLIDGESDLLPDDTPELGAIITEADQVYTSCLDEYHAEGKAECITKGDLVMAYGGGECELITGVGNEEGDDLTRHEWHAYLRRLYHSETDAGPVEGGGGGVLEVLEGIKANLDVAARLRWFSENMTTFQPVEHPVALLEFAERVMNSPMLSPGVPVEARLHGHTIIQAAQVCIASLQGHFDDAEKRVGDGSGSLDAVGLSTVFTGLYREQAKGPVEAPNFKAVKEQVTRAMVEWDLDGSGRLEEPEFLSMYSTSDALGLCKPNAAVMHLVACCADALQTEKAKARAGSLRLQAGIGGMLARKGMLEMYDSEAAVLQAMVNGHIGKGLLRRDLDLYHGDAVEILHAGLKGLRDRNEIGNTLMGMEGDASKRIQGLINGHACRDHAEKLEQIGLSAAADVLTASLRGYSERAWHCEQMQELHEESAARILAAVQGSFTRDHAHADLKTLRYNATVKHQAALRGRQARMEVLQLRHDAAASASDLIKAMLLGGTDRSLVTDINAQVAILSKAFDRADENGDGRLGPDELAGVIKEYFRRHGLSRRLDKLAEEVRRAMVTYDVDRSGTMELGEFVSMFAKSAEFSFNSRSEKETEVMGFVGMVGDGITADAIKKQIANMQSKRNKGSAAKALLGKPPKRERNFSPPKTRRLPVRAKLPLATVAQALEVANDALSPTSPKRGIRKLPITGTRAEAQRKATRDKLAADEATRRRAEERACGSPKRGRKKHEHESDAL